MTIKNKDLQDLLSVKMGAQPRYAAPYRPQTDGLCEKTNHAIATRLARALSEEKCLWPQKLAAALMAIRTTVNVATGYAPLALSTGRDVVTPIDVELSGHLPEINEKDLDAQGENEAANTKDGEILAAEEERFLQAYKKICAPGKLYYVRDMSPSKKRPRDEVFEDEAEKRLKMTQEATRNQARKTSQNKGYYDARINAQDSLAQSGDFGLVKQSRLSNQMHGRLAPKFHGPYAVVDIDGSNKKHRDG